MKTFAPLPSLLQEKTEDATVAMASMKRGFSSLPTMLGGDVQAALSRRVSEPWQNRAASMDTGYDKVVALAQTPVVQRMDRKRAASSASDEPPALKRSKSEDESFNEHLDELKKITLKVPFRETKSGTKTQDVNLGEYLEWIDEGKPHHKLFSVVPQVNVREAAKKRIDEISTKAASKEELGELEELQWLKEELAFPALKKSGGGGGNLKVEAQGANAIEIEGRPGFEVGAQQLPGMQAGYHRRHIIAWHTLRGSVKNVVNLLLKSDVGDKNLNELKRIFSDLLSKIPQPAPPAATAPPVGPPVGAPSVGVSPVGAPPGAPSAPPPVAPPKSSIQELAELVKQALEKLNSNLKNLWPGPGAENSLINTYQGLLRNWAKQAKGIDAAGLDQWKKDKLDGLDERLEQKGGAFKKSLEQLSIVLRAWEPEDTAKVGEELSAFLLKCADTFEVDYPYAEDRTRVEKVHTIEKSLLTIAGRLLDWAEGKGSLFESAKAEDALKEFEETLNKFMFPPAAKAPSTPP